MASSKNAGRRRFITREHTSDTSEVDASTVRTPEEECERIRLENISLPRDTPSAFVRVKPSSKSATLDWTFRESKNGLAVSSSRRLPQQPLVPVNSELKAQFHPASEKIVQQPLIYTPLETSTGFPPECDSLSLGFRPIRRDSLGSTSSSLAGSTVDSELTISNVPPDQLDSPQRVVKLPPHPGGNKDFTDSSSKLRPWSYYEGGGMLMPRTVLSSTGSASSYDNLDKTDSLAQQKNTAQFNSDATQVHPSPSPRFARTKHFDSNPKRTPSPPSVVRHVSPFRSDDDRQFYVVGSRMHGSKAGDTSKETLTMSGEEKAESAHFLEGVCRRRMAGGHVQVIPPHLVGVFDPSRFHPTNVHAPPETTASSFVDVEKSNSALVMKQPESATYHTMGKLPSKSPAQPSFIRPSESGGKSLLPHLSRQHTSKDVTDHSLGIHTNPTLPFASKDSGLSTGESLASASAPKVNAGRKSYKNEDLLVKDASPKFSDKHLFSASRKGGSNISNQEQELSSVTDLFHHVLPNVDSSHYGGPVFQEAARYAAMHEAKDSQMPSTKTSAFLGTNHSSPSKQSSPKYTQISAQKSSPKWDSKGGNKCEQTSSPKIKSRFDQTSAAKSSPKWERTSSAKSNLTLSPKSSPKLERTAAARRNLKWEAPSTTSAKASQQSSLPKSISKWEPTTASKDITRSKAPSSLTTATSDQLLASFSATSNLGKAEGLENARIGEKAPYNRTVSDSGQLRSQNTSTMSGEGSLPRPRTDRDKRKAINAQLQTVGASDSVFSARRKQFSSPLSTGYDKVDHQSRTGADVMVERASRPAATAQKNMDEGKETIVTSQPKSEVGNSPSDRATLDARNSNSPRKTADDAVSHSDAASDKTSTSSTSSSLHSVEKKGDAGQQRLLKSESGESDAHSTRSSSQNTEAVKFEDALEELTVVDVGVKESESAAAVGGEGGVASANSNDASEDSDALKSAEDATISKGTGSAIVVAEVGTDEREVNASVRDVADNGNFEVPQIQLSKCCSQTKTFTDILESIQVVTQPCGASSPQVTTGSTPVFGPSPSYSVPFPLFDVTDEPVIKSNQSTVPYETFAVAPVEVSKQVMDNKANQASGVGEIVLSGEKTPGSFPGESAQSKTEQNADVVNNNLKETGPSTQTICLEPSEITSPVDDRRSIDSISSSSLVELPTRELLVDENPKLLPTATEPKYSITVAHEPSYPPVVEKAIFTVDKEISFVSGLLEPDKRGSLPRKVSLHTSANSQGAGHVEYRPAKPESSSNTKHLTESTPFMMVTVSSSMAIPERETAQNYTLGSADKIPGAFQNSASGNILASSTLVSTSHLNVAQADPSFTREKYSLSPSTLPSVFDSCPLSEPVNLNEPGFLLNKNDDLFEKGKVESDMDESDETVDQGENDSKVSTASLDQITQETEIFELAKTSAAYLKPEIASTFSFISSQAPLTKTQEWSHPAGKSKLLGTVSVPKPVITQNHDSAKRDFVFTSKESMTVNMNEQPNALAGYPGLDNRANSSPFQSEVSPVMAALDDALAVLTSVVMENKNTGGDTLGRSATSAVKSKKEALKQDMEKVILSLNTDTKKAARSKSINKEGLSPSKKRTGVSHKEQPSFGHHSDPLEVTDTVHQEIQTVENRRHQLTKEDSFNRPDSPMFHETLPLPKDSIIKRNREHCRDSSSSSDSGGSPQTSPRMAPRNVRRSKRCQDASKSGSATTPLEISGYRPFMGAHSSGRTLSRHQSDIVLDMQSLTGSSLPSGQPQLHKSRRHNSDSADAAKSPWPKTVSLAQGMDTVMALPARDVKRRTDRFPLPSDIQQSLLLYNQQHGGRRGQSWMQAVDASVEGAYTGTKDKTG